jgi:predicted HicB family RNase H-like nuclease
MGGMSKSDPTTTFTFRIPTKLKARVAAAAAAEDRSVSSYVTNALRTVLRMPASERAEVLERGKR